MKGESGRGMRRRGEMSPAEAEAIALGAFQQLAADADRMGRFLGLSGLDPGSVRAAATAPGFLPGVLEHIAQDEELFLAIARELSLPPEHLERARRRLSPELPWTD